MLKALRKVMTGKWFVAAVGLVSLYALTGFLALPLLLSWYLPRFAEQSWHCRAEVESIRLNPFLLTVEINGLHLRQAKGQPLLSFDRFFADLETESLWRWALVLRELVLTKPEVNLEIEPDGAINLMQLAPATPPEAKPTSSSPLPFFLHRLAIQEAALNLTDKRQSTPAVLAVQGMNLELRNLATLADQTGTYSFAAAISDQGAVQAEGAFSLLPLRAQGKLNLKAIGLATLWQFARDSLPVEQPDGAIDLALAYDLDAAHPKARVALSEVHLAASGLALKLRDAKTAASSDKQSRLTPAQAALDSINCSLRAQLELGEGEPAVLLREMAVQLKGIKVDDAHAKEPLFAMDNMLMEGGQLDFQRQAMTVDRIVLQKGHADVVREANGAFGWQRLALDKDAKEPDKEKKAAAKEKTAAIKEKKAAAKTDPAWKVLVKSFEVEQFHFRFTDLTTAVDKPVVSVRNIKAKLTGIDGSSPMGFKIGFEVEQGGSAMLSGTVHPLIPAVEADVELRDLALMPLQPYLAPFVRTYLQSAFVSARGNLDYGLPNTSRQGGYEGSFSLNKLRLTDSAAGKPYLGWDALQLPKFKLTLQPNALEAKEIVVSKPVGAIIIGKDKTLNLAKMIPDQPVAQVSPLAPPAPKKASPKADEDTFGYRIDKIRIQGGDIAFTDLSLRPEFATRILGLQGTVLGLASAKEGQAKVQMEGQVDRFGTAKISGVLRPNDFTQASDLHLAFHNLEMKNLSPYSGRFAGRLIKSGKISADLNYMLKDRKMTGNNKLVIDNLVLGDKVEDSEGSNLPLDLAIALLQDANGRIDIGLPVTGDLNDPQFSIGSLIWKVLGNVITKAATAPFMALGSLFGSSDDTEQFNTVRFTPGNHDLAPPEKERLLKLTEVLEQRPQLKLIVQGRYSLGSDGLEVRERNIRRAVAVLLGVKPNPDGIPELLDFSDADTRDALEELYGKRLGKDALAALDKQIETKAITPRMPAWSADGPRKERGMAAKMIGGLHLYKVIPGGRSPEQSALRAGELYTRLVEQEQASDEELLRLAQRRAQTTVAHMERQGRIARERIGVKQPEPSANDEPPSAALSLDAL